MQCSIIIQGEMICLKTLDRSAPDCRLEQFPSRPVLIRASDCWPQSIKLNRIWTRLVRQLLWANKQQRDARIRLRCASCLRSYMRLSENIDWHGLSPTHNWSTILYIPCVPLNSNFRFSMDKERAARKLDWSANLSGLVDRSLRFCAGPPLGFCDFGPNFVVNVVDANFHQRAHRVEFFRVLRTPNKTRQLPRQTTTVKKALNRYVVLAFSR